MRNKLLVSTAVAASLLLAVPASAATPKAATPTPGAPSAGDPYYPTYGDGGYRVTHYDLRLKYQPATDQLDGTATLLATATQDLSSFDLDLALNVSQVLVDGRPAAFQRVGVQKLQVTPQTPVADHHEAVIVVRYSGVPSTVSTYGFDAWQRTPDGAVIADEPEAAWWWFPSNDHPSDKATFDVSVAVPDGIQVISNGVLTSKSSQLGWTRFNWREDKPQATYLATMAIGRFDITTGTSPSGIPVVNAYSPDLGANEGAAKASVERTGELVDWLTQYFGPYPFSSVGGYVPNVPTHYALENQTRVFYSPAQFAKGANTSVVVHELTHQWYGDSVSLERWSDIWLNEGFATYAQWLWSEHENEGTVQQLADYVYSSHPADDPFWTVKPGDPGAANQFADAVYDRGALAIQVLRNTIGDDAFFKLLKAWPAEHRYGNGTIAQFQALAERISGKPLADLFQTWLYTASKPALPAAGQVQPAAAAPVAAPPSWQQIKSAQQH